MKITLTEQQFKNYIRYQLTESLGETNAIRPWTDDDYVKHNASQIPNHDFKKQKEEDDEFEKQSGIDLSSWTDQGIYSKPHQIQQAKIDMVQDKLNKKVRDKYSQENGSTIIPAEKIGNVSDGVARLLRDAGGMEIGIAGKTFAYGNQKLPESTMIVNLTSAWDCPSIKEGDCPFGNGCYARGTEQTMLQTQLRNLRNEHSFKHLGVKGILELLEVYIENAPARIKNIRISEDGDFPDQKTVDFCDLLAGHLKKKYGISTTAYTHRQLNYSGVKNMMIDMSDYRIKGGTRYFIAVPEKLYNQVPDGLHLEPYDIETKVSEGVLNTHNGTFKCCCDCRRCNFCYQTKEENGETNDNPITVVELFRMGKIPHHYNKKQEFLNRKNKK